MSKRDVSISLILLVAFFDCACQSGHPPVTIANSEQFTLFSSHTQQEYRIYIHLPMSYSGSDTTYPVFYGMDADIGFGTGAEVSTILSFGKEIPEVIMVGVAYGAYPGQEGNNRIRDFTPTAVSDYNTSGGAEQYFLFLRDELIPAIDSLYRTEPDDRALSGASLSGLFTLYVLFKHPGVFNRYKISSPSILWDDGIVFDYEKEYSIFHSQLPAKVFLSVGDTESTTEAWKELIGMLEGRNYEGLELTSMMFPDATHRTACFLAGIRGIGSLFAGN